MTTKTKSKAVQLAHASNAVKHCLSRFREAQHRVIYQLSNPSLAFGYEFSKSGKDMECCRIQLAEALETADKLSWEVLRENLENNKE